jgi:hypothetical protein
MPLLGGCGGGDDDDAPATRTLFINYSHLERAGKPMWLQVNGKSYPVLPVSQAPHTLARERTRNNFLAAVDDRHVTHVVEGLPPAPADAVELQYAHTDLGNGQWTMDTFNIALPESGAAVAYARASARNGGATTLPMSAKRRKYGLPPAASARDLHEEQALLDTTSHAASLVTMHKDMMALDGAAAHTVVNAHVMQSFDVDDIDDAIGQLGSAAPQVSPGVVNPTGWATLRTMPDQNGAPRRVNLPGDPMDGHFVYAPVLHPTIATLVSQAVNNVLPGVQNDPTLGADVTAKPAGSTLRGALWARRDGKPTIVHTAAAAAAASSVPALDVQWPDGQNHWLELDASLSTLPDDTLQLDATYTNIALRYLSCYIEFYDETGALLQVGTMPGFADGTWMSAPPGLGSPPASATRVPVGVVASLGTVMGIPVFTDSTFYGSLEITLKLSKDVNRVRLYAGGLGTGSNNYPDTIPGGIAGTVLMNYVLTILFGALGAIPDLDLAFGLLAVGASALLNAIAAITVDAENGNDPSSAQFWVDQGMNVMNVLIASIATANDPLLTKFGEGLTALIGTATAEGVIEKAIPIVGIILAIESAMAAAADVALTTVTVVQSPFTYVTDLVLTHDITVTINKDSGDSTFPKEANVITAIATFDDGKPHRMDLAVTTAKPDYPSADTPMQLTFTQVPIGGNVEVRVEFHQRASLDGSDGGLDILLGAGTTGVLANNAQTAGVITIDEIAYPVGPNTRYKHNLRTYIGAGGAHVWVAEPGSSTPPSAFPCGSAGQVCAFNGITVRQGTSSTVPTMLGYAWRGQNASGGGDLGMQALLNADHPDRGYAVASDPRATAGLDIALSRNAGGSDNFYVDPVGEKPMIRGLRLDGGAPGFDGPASNRAYGMLNLSSDTLLLHPAGFLVSISGANDRFEVLKPASAAVTDAVAQQQYIAQVLGNSGDLPGRLDEVVAATITKDGTLLMLENGNNRVQAMDLGGNPVQYFVNGTTPYFLPLDEMPTEQGWRHLDIQADFTGLLYLLSFNQQSGVYRLSIYDKLSSLQKALTVTEAVFAARIGLDHWRTLYTLNYQPITVQGSGAQPAMTEPSVSQWLPCTLGLSC